MYDAATFVIPRLKCDCNYQKLITTIQGSNHAVVELLGDFPYTVAARETC